MLFFGVYNIRCQGVKVARLWGGLAVVAVRLVGLVKIRARAKDQTKGTYIYVT